MPEQIRLKNVSVVTPAGRALFQGLDLGIGNEHVALVGRNGVGKSTLLEILAGEAHPTSGSVQTRSKPYFLRQCEQGAAPTESTGEQRRRDLEEARASAAEILLLDEPSEHLDEAAVSWLRDWLRRSSSCLIVCSHDRRLLEDFEHFFVMSESGCHYFRGPLEQLTSRLEGEHQAGEQRYVRNLKRLATHEEHVVQIARRKARKKRSGRFRELDRCTPRIRLNQKRGQAQANHGRLAKLREARLAALQDWTKSTRRALSVNLPLELAVPVLPADTGRELVALRGVSESARGRPLFEDLDLRLGRERIAVTGPNGAGKTTLLDIIAGRRRPSLGTARSERSAIGSIEQGGRNWLLEDSLRDCLLALGLPGEASAQLLLSHRFPLALSERSLRSLSPGERARAALLCLFARSPAVELLILDEPTFSLDLVGLRALTHALRLWRGGLVVASHDRAFLAEIGVDRTLELGGLDMLGGVARTHEHLGLRAGRSNS